MHSRHGRTQALFAALLIFVFFLTAYAQNEYQQLSALTLTTGSYYYAHAQTVAGNLGYTKPDVTDVPPSLYYGASGPNSPTGDYGSKSPVQYLANEQREAVDDLLSGVSPTPPVLMPITTFAFTAAGSASPTATTIRTRRRFDRLSATLQCALFLCSRLLYSVLDVIR